MLVSELTQTQNHKYHIFFPMQTLLISMELERRLRSGNNGSKVTEGRNICVVKTEGKWQLMKKGINKGGGSISGHFRVNKSKTY